MKQKKKKKAQVIKKSSKMTSRQKLEKFNETKVEPINHLRRSLSDPYKLSYL